MKSFVGFTELTCLGHTVNQYGRHPDVKKTVAIDALADPSYAREVATFLGMTGFYSEYVKDYGVPAQRVVEDWRRLRVRRRLR